MVYLIQAAVFVLMVTVGMSLDAKSILANWGRVTWLGWIRLTLATFIVPPGLALLLGHILRLEIGEVIGLFMLGAAPGAPLLARNISKKGFDINRAASDQVWSAIMVPFMIPLVVWAGAALYNRTVWISPVPLFEQIIEKQLIPMALGMLILWRAPKLSARILPGMNTLGNLLFLLVIVLLLVKLGPELRNASALLPVAALLLAVGSIAAIRLLRISDPLVNKTFAICNANRHVGVALMISGRYFSQKHAVPTLVCYALVAPIVMFVYAKFYRDVPKAMAAGQ